MAAAPLTLDGLTLAAPANQTVGRDEAMILFTRLETDYGWVPEVTEYLLDELGCRTLHDLIVCFRCEDDWKDFYRADIKLSADATKQVTRTARGRVSQCREYLVKTQGEAAKIKAKGEEAVEFEKPLGSDVLIRMADVFWDRYHVSPPMEKMPGDMLISRLAKELEKRFLHVTDLMKIKGIVWERRSETIKEQVGDNLYTERTPDQQHEERAETLRSYLEVMEMYMLAMAVVGAAPVTPEPTAKETRGSDPSDYVVFPYQFSLDYLHRTNLFVTAALKDHTSARVYDMVRERDREERTEWVKYIREEKTRTIGKIFKEVYAARKGVWRYESQKKSANQSEQNLEKTVKDLRQEIAVLKQAGRVGGTAIKPTKAEKRAAKAAGKGSKGGAAKGAPSGTPVTVPCMANKRKLCPDFNVGRCPKKQCQRLPKEDHRCNGKLPNSDMACGQNHTSQTCRRCERR